MSDPLDLSEIRLKLSRIEDSIIFALFERQQWKVNSAMYRPGEVQINGDGHNRSFLEFILRGVEEVHAKAGRYQHPDEHSFTENLPTPFMSRRLEENPLKPNRINENSEIRIFYQEEVIPAICAPGDDNQYGSCAVVDVRCLQDLSWRIHFGEKVAEAKFRSDEGGFSELIRARNSEGITEKLRNVRVEEEVIKRVSRKGERYGVNPEVIAAIYERRIIPMTIKVEVDYLLARLD